MAFPVGSGVVEIFATDKKLESALDKAKGKVSSFTLSASRIVVGGLTAALPAAGIAMIKMASDAQEMNSKLDAVWGNQASSVRKWADAHANAVGRATFQVRSFVTELGDLFIPLGFSADAAKEMAQQVTQLGIDLASFNNISDSEAIERLRAGLLGSSEVLLKFGVVAQETQVKQELLRMGAEKVNGEYTAQQKVLARLNIVLAATSAAHGDAARTSGSVANQFKALQADIDNLAREIGEDLLPVTKKAIQLLRDLATATDGLNNFASDDTGIEDFEANLAKAIQMGEAGLKKANKLARAGDTRQAREVIDKTIKDLRAEQLRLHADTAKKVNDAFAQAKPGSWWNPFATNKWAGAVNADKALGQKNLLGPLDSLMGKIEQKKDNIDKELNALVDFGGLFGSGVSAAQDELSPILTTFEQLGGKLKSSVVTHAEMFAEKLKEAKDNAVELNKTFTEGQKTRAQQLVEQFKTEEERIRDQIKEVLALWESGAFGEGAKGESAAANIIAQLEARLTEIAMRNNPDPEAEPEPETPIRSVNAGRFGSLVDAWRQAQSAVLRDADDPAKQQLKEQKETNKNLKDIKTTIEEQPNKTVLG